MIKNTFQRSLFGHQGIERFFLHFSTEVLLKEVVESYLQLCFVGVFPLLLSIVIGGEMVLLWRLVNAHSIVERSTNKCLQFQIIGFVVFDVLLSVTI